MTKAQGIVFCGGGTGGHIFPGLAVAAASRAAGEQQLLWIGDPQRLEAHLVPQHGIVLLPYGLSRPRLLRPWWYLRAAYLLWKTWRHLLRQRPRCVIATGGYAALLPGLLAPLCGRPLIIIEPNARPGKTNRLLACFAQLAVIQFAEARHYLSARRVEQFGNPLRPIQPRQRGYATTLRVLIMGGSLAAQSLNKILLGCLATIDQQTSIYFVHIAGHDGVAAAETAYTAHGLQATVHAFVDDMPALYETIDLAVCRSGATSVSELCAAGIGALYIPLPWAADDHQTANARAVARVGGAVVLPQQQLTGAGLARVINRLAKNRHEVSRLGRAAQHLARPQAAAHIYHALEALAPKSAESPNIEQVGIA